jgi:hypothetical protein
MLEKAFFARKDRPQEIVPFLFNPREFTVEKSNQFAEIGIPGLGSSMFQFGTLNMDIFFDTYEQGIDVRNFTDRITGWDISGLTGTFHKGLMGLMDIDSDLHAPPVCLFVWGAYVFPCLIERASKKFTMFLPTGIPVRATLSVTLREYVDPHLLTKGTPLSSPDRSKSRVLKQGDSLWLLAAQEYGDLTQWRVIADANHLANPRILEPGKEIIIPPLE